VVQGQQGKIFIRNSSIAVVSADSFFYVFKSFLTKYLTTRKQKKQYILLLAELLYANIVFDARIDFASMCLPSFYTFAEVR